MKSRKKNLDCKTDLKYFDVNKKTTQHDQSSDDKTSNISKS